MPPCVLSGWPKKVYVFAFYGIYFFALLHLLNNILGPRRLSRSLNYCPTRKMSSTPPLRSLNIDNINPHVKQARYAVRGELAIKAEEYRAQLKKQDPPTPPECPLPFDKVISANIGNPQQLDQ